MITVRDAINKAVEVLGEENTTNYVGYKLNGSDFTVGSATFEEVNSLIHADNGDEALVLMRTISSFQGCRACFYGSLYLGASLLGVEDLDNISDSFNSALGRVEAADIYKRSDEGQTANEILDLYKELADVVISE